MMTQMTAYQMGQQAALVGVSGSPPDGIDKDEWMRGWLAMPGRPLTGNEEHAKECAETPLTAEAILKLVWDNIEYFGDGYYAAITVPISDRVAEYYKRA